MTEFHGIVAMDPKGTIGGNNQLLWHLPEDLKFFKGTTLGYPILMGRKTWQSLPKKLPQRQHIILSRSIDDTIQEDVYVVKSLTHLAQLVQAENMDKVYVIGGAQIYQLLLPYLSSLTISHVTKNYQGDAFFPSYQDMFQYHSLIAEFADFCIKCYQPRIEPKRLIK